MRSLPLLLALLLSSAFLQDDLFLNEDFDTGYLKIDKENSLFYWLFRSRDANPYAPLVIWLQGTPPATLSRGAWQFRRSRGVHGERPLPSER